MRCDIPVVIRYLQKQSNFQTIFFFNRKISKDFCNMLRRNAYVLQGKHRLCSLNSIKHYYRQGNRERDERYTHQKKESMKHYSPK